MKTNNFFSNDSFAAQNRRSSFRSFGDYMQIINPFLLLDLLLRKKDLVILQ